MTSFGWLHLTDLHMGMAQQPSLLPKVKDRFFDSLKLLFEKSQPWDLVVFTGDLTQRGSQEEFKRFDEFLNELWNTLEALGAGQPSLVAVPGNHDLVRLENPNFPTKLLTTTWDSDADLRKEFWSNAESDLRRTINTAFQNYVEWWEHTQFKPPINEGLLPGDFSATIDKEGGASLGIVGLNSTFLQLVGGDRQGKLALHSQQFQSACGGDGPAWLKKHNACLLLTHQPPDWLDEEAKGFLTGEIVGNDSFAVHLFGHMHEARYEYHSIAGAPEVRVFQGTSLFGLEQFGEGDRRLDRRHGYSAGRIDLKGEEGVLTFWPMAANRVGGQLEFGVENREIYIDNRTGDRTRPKSFPLNKPFGDRPVSQSNDGKEVVATGTSLFKKRWAVLVGINDYEHFIKLKYCRQDVVELAQKLSDELSFDEVITVHEEAKLRPDHDSILIALDELRDSGKVEPDHLLVFYFAGHGINEGGKDYLLPISAQPRHIKRQGISVQELIDNLKEFQCKHTVMFIDACREEVVAGARGAAPVIGADADELVRKASIVTFFSCSQRDRSYEIDKLQHGSFSYGILDAIKEGVVTVADLDRYLVSHVPHFNLMNEKPVQLPYTVTIPEESKKWPIFRKPSASKYGSYGPIADCLNQLRTNAPFAENILPGTLEFLEMISENLELNARELAKLNMIKALCADEATLEEFSGAWQAMNRKRITGPKTKKPSLV